MEQTAKIITDILNPRCKIIMKTNFFPTDLVNTIYSEIINRSEDLIIVGHLPYLVKLFSRLILDSRQKIKLDLEKLYVTIRQRKNSIFCKLKWFIVPEL
jgi:phosphohistidine phosphatase SixA